MSKSVSKQVIEGLEELRDTLHRGEKVSQKLTCRTVRARVPGGHSVTSEAQERDSQELGLLEEPRPAGGSGDEGVDGRTEQKETKATKKVVVERRG